MGLSTKQRKAIAALLASSTHAQAAEIVGVGERTISRWLTEPDFRAELRDAESQVISEANRQLIQHQGAAIETLAEIMANGTEGNRRLAAVAILGHAQHAVEIQNLIERIERLEYEHK